MPTPSFTSEHFDLVQVADGVFGCIHKPGGKAISNSGIIDNGRETIIFDTFLDPVAAKDLLVAAGKHNLSPIRYVINSHDHNDHVRGNQVFPDTVEILSTRKTADMIKEWEPQQLAYEKEHAAGQYAHFASLQQQYKGDKNSREYRDILNWLPYYESLMNSHKNVRTRLPDIHYNDGHPLDGPKRRVRLIARGAGHSSCDTVLFLPDDQAAFTADLVFSQCHPYLGLGEPEAWRGWLHYLKGLDILTVVPGHGPIGSPDLIPKMERYMDDLTEIADQYRSNPDMMEKEGAIPVPDRYRGWMLSRFFHINLKFLQQQAIKQNAR